MYALPHFLSRHTIVWLAVAVFVGAAAFGIYSLGFDGRWMFDDDFSLKGLAGVRDLSSASQYVFSGTTGPSGRPLALASFLINASSWPDHPGAFRATSVVVHLANALLVYLLVVALARQESSSLALPIALTASVLWLLSPLLASAVLSVVQRMTLLAATFTLLGLLAYVRARALLVHRPFLGLAAMSAALTVCTVLGVMAKESGVLLPMFAAVIEFAFPSARSPRLTDRLWQAWRFVFFLVPLLLLVAYIVLAWPGIESTYRMRSFGLSERLASEAVILWEYVRQLLIPQPRSLGLFHDDQVPRSMADPAVWLAVGAWLLAIVSVVLMRRRAPWLTLGVGGFLVGHLLESTVIPLELYFEHRNYVAAVFVWAGLAGLLWQLPKRLAALVGAAMAVVMALSLANVTTLWGRSDLAAELWFDAHPGSSRAAQFVTQERLMSGSAGGSAREAISQASERSPQASDLMLQSLVFDCAVLDETAMEARGREILARIKATDHSWAAIETLQDLDSLLAKGGCQGLLSNMAERIAEAMLANPHYMASAKAQDHIHNFLARKASERGDQAAAETHQRAAYHFVRTAANAQLVAVRMLQGSKLDEAIAFLQGEVAAHKPPRFGREDVWLKDVGDMLASLDMARRNAARSRP